MSLYVKIRKAFPKFTLDIELDSDEKILCFLGASGSGKSMTLNCIAGLQTPDEGRIIVNGTVYFDSERKINLPTAKRNVGYVFQNYALFPHMTVAENVGFGLRGLSKAEVKRRVYELLEVMRLHPLRKHFPSQLSGGQQQRVALARAMITRPAIMLMDEPFSALDTALKAELEQDMLELLHSYDGHTLFVTHNPEEAYIMCTGIALFSHGRIQAVDQKENIFLSPPVMQVHTTERYTQLLEELRNI